MAATARGRTCYGNSLVVLDAATGERRWHFQVVHHDLWDYDLPAQPLLATVGRDGRHTDIVVQVTKMGLVVRVRPRDRPAPLPHCRTRRAVERRAGRSRVADPALPRAPAAARAQHAASRW